MKGLTAALLVSAALNIALISFMAGRLAGGAPLRPEGPMGQGRALERATPQVREMVRDAFVARRDEIAPQRTEAGERRRALRDAILAEPFDRARVEAAFAAFRDAQSALQKSQGSVVIDVLAKLPLEERKTLIEALAAPGPLGRPRRDRAEDVPLDGPPPGKRRSP